MSNVLVISASPRKGGNSDTLCDEFIKGAISVGSNVTKIRLAEKKISYCVGCGTCQKNKPCPINDDVAEISDLMLKADYIVLASPVYFYCINAQMKTLIDRMSPYYEKLSNKKFVFIVTAADNSKDTFDETLAAFNGFLRCLENPTIVKVIRGYGVWREWEIKSTKAMEMALRAGEDTEEL